MLFNLIAPMSITNAASLDNVLTTLTASTSSVQDSTSNGTGLLEKLYNLIFGKLLTPLSTVSRGKNATNSSTTVPTPTTSRPLTSLQDSAVLIGKVIVVDPGHGGSNPGAVANNTREADNNLAVGLKLRDKLVQAGAKVIMTRENDRTVAPEGSSLSTELEARVNLATINHADMFISIHSNENPDANVSGAMTFYPNGKSSTLASKVEDALITETGAVNKGTSAETFYVLRNASVPSTLVEMGFVSNEKEATLLNSDTYRTKIAQGLYSGIVEYFN